MYLCLYIYMHTYTQYHTVIHSLYTHHQNTAALLCYSDRRAHHPLNRAVYLRSPPREDRHRAVSIRRSA